MTQMPLDVDQEKPKRKFYDMDSLGHLILGGRKYLVKFRDYNKFRSIKIRHTGIDGIRLVHTEDRLVQNTKKLNEFMQGEITVI